MWHNNNNNNVKNKWFSNGVQFFHEIKFIVSFRCAKKKSLKKVQVYYSLHSFVHFTWFTSKISSSTHSRTAYTIMTHQFKISNYFRTNITFLTTPNVLTFYFWILFKERERERKNELKMGTRAKNIFKKEKKNLTRFLK